MERYPLPAGLPGLVHGRGELGQQHRRIRPCRSHHIAERTGALDGFHGLQHPVRPAGGVPDVRLDDGQDHPVRLVPCAVDIIRPRRGFGIRLDLQGKGVMI